MAQISLFLVFYQLLLSQVLVVALSVFFAGTVLMATGHPVTSVGNAQPPSFFGDAIALIAATGLALTTEYEFQVHIRIFTNTLRFVTVMLKQPGV